MEELNSCPDYQSQIQMDVRAVQQSGSAFPIDFLYCWAGEAVQQDSKKEEKVKDDHELGQGFGELRYSLRFFGSVCTMV